MIYINIAAIISEYNPLHKGHEFHIESTKNITKCDGVIAVMSGSFVQRGEPAIIDKWERTRMALSSGIDLVFELPIVYSLSSAEFFAFGAVSLINSLGIVDFLSFGSEIGKIELINDIAHVLSLEPLAYKEYLKNELKKGLSFPFARENALSNFFSVNDSEIPENLLASSNNILAIEYCKALKKLKSNIKPITIKRIGEDYNSNSLNDNFASASAIRNHMIENRNVNFLKEYLTEESFKIIDNLYKKDYSFAVRENMFEFIRYKSQGYIENITKLPDVTEGLENRIFKAIQTSNTMEQLVSNVKSKRYTYTRINRILAQYFVGFDIFNSALLRTQKCPYGRILGFNDKGREMIKDIKKMGTIPLITKVKGGICPTLDLDILSTKNYSLLNSSIDPLSDFYLAPIY